MHAILYGTTEDPDLMSGIGNKLYIRDINDTTLVDLIPKLHLGR